MASLQNIRKHYALLLLHLLCFVNILTGQTTYTWIGASGGSWAVSTNWSPNRAAPATSDILQFNSGGSMAVISVPTQTIRQLIITANTDVSLQSAVSSTLTLGSAATTNVLTVDPGSTLQISSTGAVSLTIAFPALASLSTSVAGSIIINANTGLNNALNFTNLLAANHIITGSITNNGGNITSTAATTTFGAGSFYTHARNGGSIPTASYNATSTVNITGITSTNLTGGLTGTFGNITWNCAAQTATGIINGVITVNGNLQVLAGTLYDNGSQITGNASGTLAVSSGAKLQLGAATATTFPTNFTAVNISLDANSTVQYSATAAQNISGTPAYGHLTLSGASTKTLLGAITVNGNLSVNGGTLADGGFTINGTAGGTLSVASASTLQLGTTTVATSFPLSFGTITLNSASTVNYNSNLAQNISNIPSYGNLFLTSTAAVTKTLQGNSSLAGNLTINTNNTLADAGFTITVNGNVTNNAIHSGSGKIYLNGGTASHTISGTPATFGNLELDDAQNASWSSTGTAVVSGNLSITSGTLSIGSFTTSLTVNGTTDIASGATLSLTNITGTKTFTGDVTNNGTWNNSINEAVTFAGNLTHNGTTFTSGTGSYTLSGAAKTISGSAVSLTFSGAVVMSGTYTNIIPSLTISGVLSGAGTLTLGANTTLTLTASPTITGLNCTANSPNTVIYNGSGINTKNSATTYYNLTINSAGSVTQITGASTINNNLDISAGTFADGALQIVGNATGTLTVAAGATLQIGAGTATVTSFPTLFTTANITLNATSTVAYNCTGAQTISAVPSSYGNLTLSGASTKTAGGVINAAGNLTVNAGTMADGGNTITVNGNVVMTGTHSGAGKIYLNGGSAAHNLSGGGTFGNLELDDALGATMTGNIIIGTTGTLTLTAGTFSVAGFTLTLNGPAIAGTSTNLSTISTSTLSFGPNTNANAGLFIPSSVSNLGNLTINIASANSVSLNSNITQNSATGLTLTSGRLLLGNFDITLITTSVISGGSATSFVVADATGGNTGQLKKTFNTGASAAFTFPVGDITGTADYAPFAVTFSANSTVRIIGVKVNDNEHPQNTINGPQTDYVTRYWTVTDNQGGVGTYSYSAMSLTYSTNAPTDVNGTTANYRINRWDGSSWWQMNSTVAAPTVTTSQTFNETSGALGGNDFTLRVNPPQTYTWLPTSGSGSWVTPSNWNPSRNTPCATDILQFNSGGTSIATNIPSETEKQVLIANNTDITFNSTGASTISINGTTLTNNISIENGSTLSLGATVTLTFVTTASQRGDISGTLNVNTSSTFNTSAIGTTIVTVSSTGNITNNGGTFTTSAATLVFGAGSFYNHARDGGSIPTGTYNATSTANITGITSTNLTGGLTGTFGHLTWNTSGQTASGAINGVLTLSGNLTITAGTINFGANNVNVAGDVLNSGTINTSTAGATLTMNGSAAQTISGVGTWTTGTAGRLLNLTINNSAGIDLQSNLTIQTGLTLTSGTLSSSNSSTMTLGIGAAGTLTTTRTNGSLTMTTVFNLAGVTYNINYNSTAPAIAITTGNELPPTSVINYLAGTVTIANPTASGGVILNASSNIYSLTINAATTFNDNGNTLTVKGNLTNNGIHSGTGKIYLNGGTASHTISGTPAAFGNLELDDIQNATWTSTGTATVNGTLTVTAGTLGIGSFTTSFSVSGTTGIANGSTLSITNATGTKTFTGDVTNNGTWNNSGNSAVTIAGNLTHNGTTFTAGTGVYTFSGAGKTISGTAVSLSIPSMTVSGTCTNNIATLTVATALAGAGTLTMGVNTTLNIGGTSTITTLNCTANTPNTVVYTSTTAAQTVKGSMTYYNLTIDKTGQTGTVGTASITVNNNLSVNNGTFADGAFQITGNAPGTLSVNAGATLQIGAGTATVTSFPTLFTTANITLNATSTVAYNCTGAQTISAVPSSYGNLTLSGASTKTAGGVINAAGNLTVNAGTMADGGNTITVNGNVVMTGTHSGAGKIYLNGGGAAHNLSGGGTFGNLELDDALGANMTGNMIIGTTGTLTLTAGTFSVGAFTLTLNGPNVAGTASNLSTSTTSVLVFGGSASGINIPSGVAQLGSLTVNNANGITLTSNITVNSATGLTLTSGKLFLGNYDFTYASTATATGGTLNSSNMIVADATGGNTGQVKKNFPSGSPPAFVFAVGDVSVTSDYSPVTLTLTSNNAVRTIGVKVNDAVHPNNGSPTDYISRYWTFTDDVAGGTYSYTVSMNYSTSAPTDLTGVHGNLTVNRWDGSGWTQYTTAGASPTIAFSAAQTNAGNPLGGSDFTGRSPGTATTYTWNQAGTADWTAAANWTPARTTPSSTDILQFNNGATTTANNVPTQTIRQLLVSANTNLSLESPGASTLNINGPGATNNLQVSAGSTLQLSSTGSNSINITIVSTAGQLGDISGSFILNSNTSSNNTLTTNAVGTTVVTIASGGSIQNNGGTVTGSTATLVFAAGSTYIHAMNGGNIPAATWNAASTCNITGITTTNPSPFTGTFGHLTWNCAGQTSASGALSAASTVNGNLSISAGTFSDGGFAITGNAAGFFTVASGATFTTLRTATPWFPTLYPAGNISLDANSTFNYAGTAGFTIPNTPVTTYGILSINGGVTKTLSGATTVNGLVINSGTLADGGFQITGNAAGTLTVAAGATLQIGAGTATITSFPTNFVTANISLNATSTVNYNTITNPQTVSAVPSSYGNLTVTGASGTKTAGGALVVAGNLTIATAGETFADGGNTISVNGNIINNATHSGAGKILLTGGSASHAVNGATNSFGNLELDDSQGAAFSGTGVTTISGNISVTTGNFSIGSFTTSLSVTGTTSIAAGATLSISSATGTKTFTGDVTNNETWNNSANEDITFVGNLLHNGSSFTAGTGVYTFSGAGKTISGSAGALSIPNLSVSGTCTSNIITLTVGTALSGAGTLTMGTGTTLNIGGTSAITGLNCTTNTPNTVVYTSNTAAQTVKGTTYYNLIIDKTGQTATQGASATINNNLTVSNGTFSDGAFQIVGNATGMLTVSAGAILQIGTGTATITSFPTNFSTPNITLNSTSTVVYNTITNPQTISSTPSSYGNLSLSGNSVKTANGAIAIAGNLTVNGGTFADGGFQISGNVTGNMTMASGTGLILGITTASTLFPSDFVTANISLNAASTVTYNSNPAQNISGVPVYGNLSTVATSAITKTLLGNITVAGNLNNGVNNTLNLNNFSLTLAGSYTNSGTITANGASSAIVLNGTAASQTFTVGTYTGNLISNFTAGNTNAGGVVLGANLNVTNLTISTSSLLNLNARTLSIAGTYSNSGTLTGNAASSTMVLNGSSPQSFTVGTYTGSALNGFTISNAAGVTLASPLNVSGTFTLTNGILSTTSTNILAVTATGAASVSGGSTTSYVNGPMTRSFPASLATGSTYAFPMGKSAYNLFEMVNPTTSVAGTVTVEVFDATSGGTAGFGLTSLNTNRYWQASTSSGFLTYATVRLTEPSLGTANRVGQSSSLNGTYNSRGGSSPSPVLSNGVSTTLDYFVLGTSGAVTLNGTYTVGNSRQLLKLTDVANALNTYTVSGNVIFELQNDYDGTVGETYPIIFYQYSSASYTVTIRPATGVSMRTTSGTTASLGLITLSGIDKITFDGRAGGSGSSSAWTIQNTTSGSAYPVFDFIDGGSNNTLQYLAVLGSGSSATATILLSTSTVAGGNSNNTIRYCNIGNYSAQPYAAILSNGTAGANANSTNSILNNNIYNFQSNNNYSDANILNGGVVISSTGNGSNWTISNNSFYADVITTGKTLYVIYFQPGASSTGNIISGNYIGGQAPQCGTQGTYWRYNGIPASWNGWFFEAINVESGGITVSNNTISNIKMNSTSQSQHMVGIYIVDGPATVSGNMIGHESYCYSMYGANAGQLFGILNVSSGAVSITNNTIANGTSNFDGSPSSFNQSGVCGISSNLPGGVNSPNTITNNTIYNLSNEDNYNSSYVISGWNFGIGGGAWYGPMGDINCKGGSVNSQFGGQNIMIVGIYLQQANANGNHSISNNTIFGLNNLVTGGTNDSYIIGIFDNVYGNIASRQININANTVYGLYGPDTYGSPGVNYLGLIGIFVAPNQLGTHYITNNMVQLGYKTDGTSVRNSSIRGIWDNSDWNNNNLSINFYFNNIYIGGSETTCLNSYAFSRSLIYSSAVYDLLNVRNNIFVNQRSGASSNHYGIFLNDNLNATSNYNLVYGTGTGFTFGNEMGTDYATLATWQAGTSLDANSIANDPLFVDPAVISPDLHIQSGSPAINAGTNIAGYNDFDAQARSNPPDIGGDEYSASYDPPDYSLTGCGGQVPLPIELLFFNGKMINHKAFLYWVTLSEINNDYFTVERANPPVRGNSDALIFSPVGTVKGAGTSSTPITYEFIDNSPSLWEGVGGWVYYRLKQTDFDGKYAYSPVIALSESMKENNSVAISSNPVTDILGMMITSSDSSAWAVRIIDLSGREVYYRRYSVMEGVNLLQADVADLAKGIYFLRIENPAHYSEAVFIRKIVKL